MHDSTWLRRELPILRAVVSAEERGSDLKLAVANAVPELSDRDVRLCLVRLGADGYLDIHRIDNASGEPVRVVIRSALPPALRAVGLWPSQTPIEQKRARRLQFMDRLFHLTDGEKTERVFIDDLRQSLGWPEDEFARVLDYLMNEDLVDTPVIPCHSLTHRAVVEMEAALMAPDEPTEHFPPISLVIHGDVTNSQIQLGTSDSQQGESDDHS